ncbi:hypothetical protein C6P40_000079 [Pichia californica]|uniref:Allantoate permease n=1 Tax=Pichia californica TaxID=460514 RepID=A0A9P6WPS7_9ASCO|nr:hypothetical protein C6P40_000079 [[Candida] californica]
MLESLKPGKQLAEITEITEMSDSSNLSDQLSSILSQKHENIFKNNIDENVDEVEGLDYLKKCSKFTEEELSTLDRKVRWKIDVWITPRIFFKYTLQFLDKLSLNYAAAYSFNKDLIVDQSYSWVAAIFNFGYLAGAMHQIILFKDFQLQILLILSFLFG